MTMSAVTPDQSPVREGEVLAGRYRVERVLAVGGMGVVVAAKHVQLGHRVAVKVLTHNAGSSQSNARFLTEAKASALLRSDHVVHVSDVGTLDSGQPFMVMDLLEGADLAEVLDKEGKQPIAQAVDYVLQACEGLAEAHAARIVHRDLKPGNLFRALRPDGTEVIKVLDFGVSKAHSQDVRAEGTVTTTDAVFGSPLYMSPEQMQSATTADERSDIWSIGVVLYELLTRHMPFEAESMAGLAIKIAMEPPIRLLSVLPEAPPELEAVIFKCLAKNPQERYQNVAELAADLEPFAPSSRPHVEHIQRLVFGTTNPPRNVPSAPSLRRLVPAGAETLGPLDAGDSSSHAVVAPPKKRALPLAVGLLVVAAIGTAGVFLVKRGAQGSTAVTAPPTHGVATTLAPPSAGPSVAIAPRPTAESATAAATATATTPTASEAPTHRPAQTSRPAHHPPVVATSVEPAHTAAATSSAGIITGISRDRK